MKHTFIIRNPEVKNNAIAFIGSVPLEPLHEVIIREHKKDRSASQNSLYWTWITIIAGEMGLTKDEVHYWCKDKFLVRIYERDNEEYAGMIESIRKVHESELHLEADNLHIQVVNLTSTTTATVTQFTEYLNDIEKDAINKGIVLPHPEDRYYEAMGIKR
jgi:thiaminase